MKSITHKTLALVAMLIGLAIVVTNVSAQSQSAPYRLIDLGTLPGHDTGGAFDINNLGQVVGYSGPWNGSHAVLWEGGAITDLGTRPLGQQTAVGEDRQQQVRAGDPPGPTAGGGRSRRGGCRLGGRSRAVFG